MHAYEPSNRSPLNRATVCVALLSMAGLAAGGITGAGILGALLSHTGALVPGVTIRPLLVGIAVWILAAAAVGGVAVAVVWRLRLQRHLDSVAETATTLMAGNLQKRLPETGGVGVMMQAVAINRMLDQIEQLITAMSGVTNAIAHDLRTPLTEVRTRLEGLLRDHPLTDPVAAELEEALLGIDRLIDVFKSLLRLAELDSGTRRSAFQPVDLFEVVTDMVEFYAPLADAKGMSIRIVGQSTTARADRGLLAQAIGNLVDNAIKYTPRGGRVNVTVELDTATRIVRIHVTDNGPGIPEEDRPRLLQPFQRGSTSRGSSGSGLGLSLVQSIIRFHGGTLELEDAAPGVRATIEIPVSDRSHAIP